jgi:hypothetical protein
MTFQSSLTMRSLRDEWSTTPDRSGLGSSPFARRYLGNRCFFLFLRVLRCFSSPGYLLYTYVFSIGYLRITIGEFPHSEICGLTAVCAFPQLIAACHVLRRLLVPRHPPCALIYLTYCLPIFRMTASPVHSRSLVYRSTRPSPSLTAPCPAQNRLRNLTSPLSLVFIAYVFAQDQSL